MSVAESGPQAIQGMRGHGRRLPSQTAVLVLLREGRRFGAHRRDEPRRGQREDMWRGAGWRPSARLIGLAIGVLVLVGLAAARGVHRADCEPRIQAHRGTFTANLRHCALLFVEL